MPNLPGRYAYSMAHQRERAVIEPRAAPPTVYWPCRGCGARVPEGQKCSPCATEAVRAWLAASGLSGAAIAAREYNT